MAKFDPLAPFANNACLNEVLAKLKKFEYKLYGKIPRKFYGGRPTKYEFDLDLGVVHFTEKDFKGLSAIFARINKKWGTQMTFCIFPAYEKNRHMILNIRGSPKAPSKID